MKLTLTALAVALAVGAAALLAKPAHAAVVDSSTPAWGNSADNQPPPHSQRSWLTSLSSSRKAAARSAPKAFSNAA